MWNMSTGSARLNVSKIVRSAVVLSLAVVICTALSGCEEEGEDGFSPPGPPPPRPAMRVLDVPFVAQQTDVWCWAAVSEMVFRYYGTGTDQCRILSAWTGVNCCLFPSLCRTPAPLQTIQNTLYSLGGLNSYVNHGPLSFSQIVQEINAGRPMIVSYSGSFIGHVVVLYGYSDDGRIYIHDPFYGTFVEPYANTFVYSGQLFWSATILGID